ncbi:MBL fold metallo-hydrolase [Streptacidiphilus sp. N1-12]|uniref:MBL fold metallo-hydrolase n=2 Tax=Streptacidiphilus alkalitolerans TaxID=3342712 RepID=A0ABV6WN89_9ACTN
MVTIEFWGGLGVIGGSKVMVRDGAHRVLLDIGLDIPSGRDPFRAPVRTRPGRELADRLRLDVAPHIPGLFDPAALDPGSPLAEPVGAAGDTAVFVSHPHIDHVGLAGFVRADIPVHAHTDAVDLLRALDASGQGLAHGDPHWHRLDDRQRVAVGPMEVECVAVDHDVPGASGYLVHTSDGTLAFTGDIRFHGRHPQRSWGFTDRAADCDVLVTEGTTLGWETRGPLRGEADVERDFAAALERTPGLVLLSMYARDLERVGAFLGLAGAAGRSVVWPAPVAAFLRLAGVGGRAEVLSAAEVPLSDVHGAPSRYVVAPDPDDLPSLLDLPVGEGFPASVLVHANGEPLGPFEPRWEPFTDWLAALGVELRQIGCSGHADQDQLHHMLERMRPRVVFPIHTTAPARLHPPLGMSRVLAGYGRRYDFRGRTAGRAEG